VSMQFNIQIPVIQMQIMILMLIRWQNEVVKKYTHKAYTTNTVWRNYTIILTKIFSTIFYFSKGIVKITIQFVIYSGFFFSHL